MKKLAGRSVRSNRGQDCTTAAQRERRQTRLLIYQSIYAPPFTNERGFGVKEWDNGDEWMRQAAAWRHHGLHPVITPGRVVLQTSLDEVSESMSHLVWESLGMDG